MDIQTIAQIIMFFVAMAAMCAAFLSDSM